jgi:hypothetical protein
MLIPWTDSRKVLTIGYRSTLSQPRTNLNASIQTKSRYWKKIIAEGARLEPTYRRLETLDRMLKQTPFIRRFTWNIAVVATK